MDVRCSALWPSRFQYLYAAASTRDPFHFGTSKYFPHLICANVEILQIYLRQYGLPSHGTKKELYDRLLGKVLFEEELKHIPITSPVVLNDEQIREEEDASSTAIKEWVQCETCSKWRAVSSKVNIETLPDTWLCSMNSWDANYNSCTAPEEPQDEEIDNCVSKEEEEEEEDKDVDKEKKQYTCPSDGSIYSYRDLEAMEKNVLEKMNDFSEADKLQILSKFKTFIVENQAQKIEQQEKVRKRKREQEEKAANSAALYAATLDETAHALAKKKATSTNSKRQLPIHTFPSSYKDEKMAIKMLRRDLHFGASVDAVDKWDRTPLHYACMQGYRLYADVLLRAGAHPFACDIGDRCPEEVIPMPYLFKFANFMRECGAGPNSADALDADSD